MRTFVFKEMLLVSFREKKARRITFDPKVTLVRGNNETGKSSLIKTIFRTFGAEPAKVHGNWADADVRSLIRFEVAGQQFALLRLGTSFAAFDARGKVIARFKSVTNELAPFLSTLFHFGLKLPTRDRAFIPLPPAYYFLPSYMDQDASWTNAWSSFAKLEQFPNWKRGVIEYHAGIRGNEYYEAQAAKLSTEGTLNAIRRKREGLQEIYADLSKRFATAAFNVDFSAYRVEVDELLNQCELLRAREEAFKARISELRNQRQSLKTQLDITMHAREESRRDYDHASTEIGDEIECPTCGASYANSFAERFSIAVDEDHCAGLTLNLTQELAAIDARIDSELELAKKTTAELGSIEQLLAKREGEIALADLIQQQGRRELREVMAGDINRLEGEEGQLTVRIKNSEEQMKRLDSRERRKQVNEFYEQKMRLFLNDLDVLNVPDKAIKKIDAPIRDTGSELPRALLAYQMAFFHVVAAFGSAALAPLVIDSPNQQDQDDPHLGRILRFIQERHPKDRQLILALVDTAGVRFDGTEIALDRKYSLLSEDEFPQVGEEVQHFVDQAVQL